MKIAGMNNIAVNTGHSRQIPLLIPRSKDETDDIRGNMMSKRKTPQYAVAS